MASKTSMFMIENLLKPDTDISSQNSKITLPTSPTEYKRELVSPSRSELSSPSLSETSLTSSGMYFM